MLTLNVVNFKQFTNTKRNSINLLTLHDEWNWWRFFLLESWRKRKAIDVIDEARNQASSLYWVFIVRVIWIWRGGRTNKLPKWKLKLCYRKIINFPFSCLSQTVFQISNHRFLNGAKTNAQTTCNQIRLNSLWDLGKWFHLWRNSNPTTKLVDVDRSRTFHWFSE
jgi:hypothetical protein